MVQEKTQEIGNQTASVRKEGMLSEKCFKINIEKVHKKNK